IMAASAIAISSDSSDKSMGSPPSRVILFGDIPTVIPSTSVVAPETSTIARVISSAAPVVEMTLVTSPTGLCGLIPYSDSDSDSPNEMSSPEHISPLPAISPFLCTDSSEAPDSSDGPPSLGSRHASPHSSDHHSSSSSLSSDSTPVHSSGLDAPDQAHSGSSTRDVSPRLGYLEEEDHDVSARHFFVGVLLHYLLFMRSLDPTCADPLPPRKRFGDSYSSEASIKEDTEIDPIETEVDMEVGISDGDDVRDHVKIDPRDVRDDTEEYEADTSIGDTVEVGIDQMSAPIVEEEIVEPAGEDPSDSSGTRDGIVRLVPSCFVTFDLEPLSLSFDFIFFVRDL
ncbi:hypothetical protein Tco_0025168, partial [Tanacetum coccineum]